MVIEPSPPATLGRRSVLNLLLGGSVTGLLGVLLYPIVRFVMPLPEQAVEASSVVAARAQDLPVGASKLFRFGSQPALVIRTSSDEVRAFSAVCTHLQCTVQYRADLDRIWCACHNGLFDLSGKNVGGPPPRPLEELTAVVRGDEIIVTRTKS
jgi:cytochrome b6-f complex iron-sulfur subunit